MTLETDVIRVTSQAQSLGRQANAKVQAEIQAIAAYTEALALIPQARLLLATCEQETAAREARAVQASAEYAQGEAAVKEAEAAAEAARGMPDAATQAGIWRTEEKQEALEAAQQEARRLHSLAYTATNNYNSAQSSEKGLRVSLRQLEAMTPPETPLIDLVRSYKGGA